MAGFYTGSVDLDWVALGLILVYRVLLVFFLVVFTWFGCLFPLRRPLDTEMAGPSLGAFVSFLFFRLVQP